MNLDTNSFHNIEPYFSDLVNSF